MAVTGVFNADFASFYTAVTKADAQLLKLTETTGKANTASTTFADSYRKIDGVLGAAGIHMGPVVKGLDDIAAVSGKAASAFTAFEKAGLLAGAFMTGMKIGQWVDEWTGLSSAIERAAASFMGWETAGLAAANTAETLAKATEIAKRPITDMTEAIKIVAGAMATQQAQLVNWNAKLADAQREVRGLDEAERAGIATMQRAGATTAEITTKYSISALALKELAREQDLTAEATKKHAAAQEALLKNFDDARSNAMKRMHAEEAAAMEAAAAQVIEQEQLFEELDIKARISKQQRADAEAAAEAERLAASEEARIAANQAEIDAILKVGAAHTEGGAVARAGADQAVQGYQAVAQQVTITGEAVKEWINLMKYTAEVNAVLSSGSGLFTTQSQRERVAQIGSGRALPADFSMGGSVGGSTTVNNSFNLVDTESNLARKVSETIMQTVRAGTQLGTA